VSLVVEVEADGPELAVDLAATLVEPESLKYASPPTRISSGCEHDRDYLYGEAPPVLLRDGERSR